ncbi:glycoside hydrolase family 13 protein [Anaerotalea alkaliphila]|uniref:Alpha-glucosidase n=1 Tax=Anaerotalea alkaliphila TaxID=2662126 RepID=A0A7X5HWM9_9FIRM|nr:alpha-glucosidase [Anaerotalea alkaliphila]NDL68030.1 alpha-glucosidase [Anaerotalea alkaliphila]
MERKWWHNAVVYQIYPRSFKDTNGDGIGDLRGVIEKLDYLQALGVDVVWMSPVYRSPMDDNGYDISDYRDIAPEFGTMADFDEMVAEADKRGIKIVMDLVVNHTSDEHAWFLESRASKDNPKRDWYIWKEPMADGSPPNNWNSWFTRSAWEMDPATGECYLHLFSRKQPDLNWENPAVRDAVYGMMEFWLEKGICGFRMDVINLIGKPQDFPDGALEGIGVMGIDHFANHSSTHMFLREMNLRVLSRYDILTVGETPNVTTYEGKLYSHPGRKELGMVFQFEHMDVDRPGSLSPKLPLDLPKLKEIMSRWQEDLFGQGWNSLYWSNHDQPRAVSRYGDDGAYRVESAKMLGTTLHFMQGTPYIYQGEELGMTNTYYGCIGDYNDLYDHHRYEILTSDQGMGDEEALDIIRPFSRDNARAPMHWNGGANGGFTTGTPWLKMNENHKTVNAEAALEDPDSVFHHYRKLVALRKDSPYSNVIVYGGHRLLLPEDPDAYCYKRSDGKKTLLVVSNFTGRTLERRFDDIPVGIVISNYKDSSTGLKPLALRPYESVVYEVL